jgi:hypothetical protein
MKNILPWILLIICLILDLGLSYMIKKERKNHVVTELQFRTVITENEKFKTIIGHFYQKEGSFILDEGCVTEEGYKINLHEVIKSVNKVLIFRYTSSDCSDCVDTVFRELTNAQNIDKIIVISDFNSVASMQYLKKKHNLENTVFLKSVNTNMSETPCVFLSNKEFKINKFLIIHPNDKVLDKYLKII